jgi:hypothetical protein
MSSNIAFRLAGSGSLLKRLDAQGRLESVDPVHDRLQFLDLAVVFRTEDFLG